MRGYTATEGVKSAQRLALFNPNGVVNGWRIEQALDKPAETLIRPWRGVRASLTRAAPTGEGHSRWNWLTA